MRTEDLRYRQRFPGKDFVAVPLVQVGSCPPELMLSNISCYRSLLVLVVRLLDVRLDDSVLALELLELLEL